MLGSETRRNSSSCATPTVAISSTRRGLSNSRRTTDSSITMPITALATIANANASQYGTPYCTWNNAKIAAPIAPISPCAKFNTPVARYTSTNPAANTA